MVKEETPRVSTIARLRDATRQGARKAFRGGCARRHRTCERRPDFEAREARGAGRRPACAGAAIGGGSHGDVRQPAACRACLRTGARGLLGRARAGELDHRRLRPCARFASCRASCAKGGCASRSPRTRTERRCATWRTSTGRFGRTSRTHSAASSSSLAEQLSEAIEETGQVMKNRARQALREIGRSRHSRRAGGAIDRRAVRRARRPRER